MNKIKWILIGVVCVMATMVDAQESSLQNKYFEDGKSWLRACYHYTRYGPYEEYQIDTTYWTETVVGDTIVDGHRAKKLLRGNSDGVPYEPPHYSIGLEEDGVIYKYGSHRDMSDSIGFYPIMDFNLHIGDSIFYNSPLMGALFLFEVVNEETINVCGIERRKLTLESMSHHVGYWVEGIGANTEDFYMIIGFPQTTCEAYFYGMVKCFQDGECIFTVDDFNASVDGVRDVKVSCPDGKDASDKSLYDLSGRKVTGTPRRGIYIKGGRKVLVK